MTASPQSCDVFLSYSRLDRAVVAPIAKLLRVTHACVFRDEDSIPLGKRWDEVISEALTACHTVVVFWSVAAADSKAVAAEYTRALRLGKNIVPVLLDDTPVVKALARYQWLDFREFIQEGRELAIKAEVYAATAAVGWAPLGQAAGTARLYRLLYKAQAEGFGVIWDEETERQIVSLLSSRLDSSSSSQSSGDNA